MKCIKPADRNCNARKLTIGSEASPTRKSVLLTVVILGVLMTFATPRKSTAAILFETDWSGGTINEFSPNGSETVFANGLQFPSGLAFNAAGDLLEADEGSGNVYEFSPSGAKSTFASGLGAPVGLAFGSNGDLFVSDVQTGDIRILKITPSGSTTVFVNSGLLFPRGMAFGPNGNLFVADFNRIDEITPSGSVSTFIEAPYGAIDLTFASNGNLFFTDGQQEVYEVTPSGSESLFGQVPSLSNSIAIDSSGDVFVGDRGNGENGGGFLYEFSPTGARTTFATGLSNPEVGLIFAPVPEPSSSFLFAIGIVGLAFGKRWWAAARESKYGPDVSM